jgi:hypothetical protein
LEKKVHNKIARKDGTSALIEEVGDRKELS